MSWNIRAFSYGTSLREDSPPPLSSALPSPPPPIPGKKLFLIACGLSYKDLFPSFLDTAFSSSFSSDAAPFPSHEEGDFIGLPFCLSSFERRVFFRLSLFPVDLSFQVVQTGHPSKTNCFWSFPGPRTSLDPPPFSKKRQWLEQNPFLIFDRLCSSQLMYAGIALFPPHRA